MSAHTFHTRRRHSRASLTSLLDGLVAQRAIAVDGLQLLPIHIAAVHEQLCDDPIGGQLLAAAVDPVAACVAATHWLAAATVVTAAAWGSTPAEYSRR